MPTDKSAPQELAQRSILSYAKDLPNLCSLSGLACTLAAIYFILTGVYWAAMIGIVWAVAFDWADGLIARRMSGRTGDDRVFGGQLDLLIDIVSYGVTPAILVLSFANFDPLFLPGAFLMLAACAIRLSYFSTFGLAGGANYTGLAMDNNSLILVFIFLFEGMFSPEYFAILLAVSGVVLAALNVSQIQSPKLSGNPRNVFILAAYTLGISAIYGWKLL